MPRLKPNQNPSYRLHRQSGQAVVTLNGKDVLLGKYNTPESRQAYDRAICCWIANGRQRPDAVPDLSIAELVARFWTFAEGKYRTADGAPKDELQNYKHSLTPLLKLYSRYAAAKFGAADLRAVQTQMIADGLCRNVVNRRLNRVRYVFRWAVSYGHLSATLLAELDTVEGLRYGDAEVKESAPVKPVPEWLMNKTLPHLSRTVRAMADLQILTGMRSTELCIMRGCDIDTKADPTGRTWDYKPEFHKNQHRGHTRTIILGPACQRIIQPFLKRDLARYLFCPADAEQERREAASKARAKNGTPLSCGNVPGSNRQRKPQRMFRDRYNKDTYALAITIACRKAFPPPDALARLHVPCRGRKKNAKRWESHGEWKARLGSEKWAQLVAWEKAHHWFPHQCRHSRATMVSRTHGADAARVALGHATLDATALYAERDMGAYRRMMAAEG